MTKYVTIRLTAAQAEAASNACDLIRDMLEADGDRREAALYKRASEALAQTEECSTCLGNKRIRDADTGELRRCLDCGGTGTQ